MKFKVLTLAAFYTFADASLAMIPLTVFWKLRISVLQRIQLCIVFGLNIPWSFMIEPYADQNRY